MPKSVFEIVLFLKMELLKYILSFIFIQCDMQNLLTQIDPKHFKLEKVLQLASRGFTC